MAPPLELLVEGVVGRHAVPPVVADEQRLPRDAQVERALAGGSSRTNTPTSLTLRERECSYRRGKRRFRVYK